MQAEIISIGDELAAGQRLDTNSQWLSQRLGELGIAVRFLTTVADDLGSCVEAFRNALGRADVVISTGGLGPTADDLTRQTIAEATGTELVLDEDALERIRRFFTRLDRQMPERNRSQAMFPRGSRPIRNPNGTAPGIAMDIQGDGGPTRLFALPGVPAEMFEIWRASVAPALAELTGGDGAICHRRIKCFGVGESDLEAMLPDLVRRGRSPSVGITVHAGTITLRVTARGPSAKACHETMAPTIATIRECLGELVFGDEDDELQHVVVRLLVEQGLTLATAECGTTGRIAGWLGELPEAAGVYRGGMVVPDQRMAMDHRETADLTKMMARGCREQFGAALGLSVGPIPPPGRGREKPAEFHFALAGADEVTPASDTAFGHPAMRTDRSAKKVLNWLRLHLLG